MTFEGEAATFAPPLSFLWRSQVELKEAIGAANGLYGITASGTVVAINGADGSQRWATQNTYVGSRMARQGSRLVAYRRNEGLAFIDDMGSSATERVVVSFGAGDSTNLSVPTLDGKIIYYAVNQGLYAVHQDLGLQSGTILSDAVPHAVALTSDKDVLTIDGYGVPTRYEVGGNAFTRVWTGEPHGVKTAQSWKPFVITGNLLVVNCDADTIAYDLTSGQIAWHVTNVPGRAFAVGGGVVYAAFNGAALWALRASDGAVLWQRQYIYDTSVQREYRIALVGDYVYFGGVLASNPDGAILLAANAVDGSFSWLSRAAAGGWSGGLPVSDGTQLYTFGSPYVGAYTRLPLAPNLTPERISITPRPLRGPASQFGSGSISIDLPVSARVSVTAYREVEGAGAQIASNTNWGPGVHDLTWNVGAPSGYSDISQFGYILIDVTESNGTSYTQSALLPVNTFPDIVWHWARTNIEIMTYHKYVSGYPDQTFRANALVTRAESSTIIAKTLNLEAPSHGFQTKFTDIASHWARPYIMALEELGVIGGFLEPDGTYTFRPDLNMTRAQEARILVKAYGIPPAPSGFATRFIDIGAHWAADDIKALEAAGYVNGFRESDGTYTYRPEQNLTRAELSTVVVRIRLLTR